MKKSYLLLTYALVLLVGKVFAQTESLKGVAFDKVAESPLAFVSVSLHLAKDSSLVNGQLSASDGSFLFDKVKRGDYFVRLQFLGYEMAESSRVAVGDKQAVDLGHIALNVNPQFLNEVQVTGRQLQSVNKIDKQVYRAEQFEAARGGTAIDVIRNMPRSEEHTSELQSLMRISYAVFCLKTKKRKTVKT